MDARWGIVTIAGFTRTPLALRLTQVKRGDSTTYCNAGQNGAYCLQTITDDFWYWAITCTNGTPNVVQCPDSCGTDSTGHVGC